MGAAVSVTLCFCHTFAQNFHFRLDVLFAGVGRVAEFKRVCAKGVCRNHMAARIQIFSMDGFYNIGVCN